MARKKRRKKTARKGRRKKARRKTSRRKTGIANRVPLKILEKRLVKLNRIVKSRGGKSA